MKTLLISVLLGFGLLITALVIPTDAHAEDQTTLKVMIVYGFPGHSAVHLQRGERQLYWDPGGYFGTEYDDCVKDMDATFCRRLEGFPWEYLQEARQRDVFFDEAALLTRILSIYHLDGDVKIQIFTFPLTGDRAERAWRLLADGAKNGRKSDFNTEYGPMFCVKAVTAFLRELDGQFKNIARPLHPKKLAKLLVRRGAVPSDTYTLNHPTIREYIASVRERAGLAPLALRKETE